MVAALVLILATIAACCSLLGQGEWVKHGRTPTSRDGPPITAGPRDGG